MKTQTPCKPLYDCVLVVRSTIVDLMFSLNDAHHDAIKAFAEENEFTLSRSGRNYTIGFSMGYSPATVTEAIKTLLEDQLRISTDTSFEATALQRICEVDPNAANIRHFLEAEKNPFSNAALGGMKVNGVKWVYELSGIVSEIPVPRTLETLDQMNQAVVDLRRILVREKEKMPSIIDRGELNGLISQMAWGAEFTTDEFTLLLKSLYDWADYQRVLLK